MPLPVDVESIAGAQALFDWFGYWPDFHDARVVKLQFDLSAPITLSVQTWELTNRVNTFGFYETAKHVTVEFLLDGIVRLDLQDPRENSILLSLGIRRSDAGFSLDLTAAYGISGEIDAEKVSLRITPGKP